MRALIFAAGLGTRLKPLTDTVPKALVPVGGQPLLYHVLQKLKAAGVREITVNVHHFADEIIGYLAGRPVDGVTVTVSDERDLLRETGGGIRFAEPLLKPSGGHFLVHNVDILSNLDLRWFGSQAPADALAALAVSDRRTQRYFLFREESPSAGGLCRADGRSGAPEPALRLVGWTNVATGEVRTPFADLDVAACRKLAFSGIHLISDRIFEVFRTIGAPERFSITDFYLRVCADHPIYGIVPPDFRMIDVGKPEALREAEKFLNGD